MVSVEVSLCAVVFNELKNYGVITVNTARKNLTTNFYE
jgi:hypothetical protein